MSQLTAVAPGTTEKQQAEAKEALTKNQSKPAPPCVLVIFGGAGDLTKRLLIPSLYNLQAAGLLPDKFRHPGSGSRRQRRRVIPQGFKR